MVEDPDNKPTSTKTPWWYGSLDHREGLLAQFVIIAGLFAILLAGLVFFLSY